MRTVLRWAASLRLVTLLALAALLGFGPLGPSALAREALHADTYPTVQLAELPPEAKQTLALIQRGGPFPYPRKDGSTFGNREKRLPMQAKGYYREYTVPTPGSRDRGARRIVAGEGRGGDVATSGEYYDTDDHYGSFRRIRQ